MISRLYLSALCAVLLLHILPAAADSAENTPISVPLGTGSELTFATQAAASAILSAKDEYTSRMSRFDRMLRLKSADPVPHAEYFAHMAGNALAWTDADIS